MSEYAVLLAEDAREFLKVADEKAERVCTEKLEYLAENPYHGYERSDEEKFSTSQSPLVEKSAC
jgi:hypothetical protein